MSKILCVPTKSFLRDACVTFDAQPLDLIFWDRDKVRRLVDEEGCYLEREVAENDESHLQIIPYVALFWIRDGDVELVTYRRPVKGQEDRLHGKMSVGFGGHVDLNDSDSRSHMDAVLLAAERELQEELGVSIASSLEFESHYAGLIYTPQDAVGRVHLGVCFVFYQRSHNLKPSGEVGELRVTALTKLQKHFHSSLENWSAACLPFFHRGSYGHFMEQKDLWEHYSHFKQQLSYHQQQINSLTPRLSNLIETFTGRLITNGVDALFHYDGKTYRAARDGVRGPYVAELTVHKLDK